MTSVRLEVIEAERLDVDPDVQLEFALIEKRWRHMGANWDPSKQGVLEVTPQNGSGRDGRFWVIDGRHRLLGGREIAGVKHFRCDVHHPTLTPREKAILKLGLDFNRRAVKHIESFLIQVIAGEPGPIEMKEIAEKAGFKIGKTSSNGPATTIEAVSALTSMYRSGLMPRALALNTLWLGQPKTNSGMWLNALHVFCRNGWDEKLSQVQYAALREVIPAVIWRNAIAESTTRHSSSTTGGQIASLIAEALRKKARIRR